VVVAAGAAAAVAAGVGIGVGADAAQFVARERRQRSQVLQQVDEFLVVKAAAVWARATRMMGMAETVVAPVQLESHLTPSNLLQIPVPGLSFRTTEDAATTRFSLPMEIIIPYCDAGKWEREEKKQLKPAMET